MGAPKLTPWFQPGTNPEYAGVYQVQVHFGGVPTVRFAKFDHGFWHKACVGRFEAFHSMAVTLVQRYPWRGHAQPSKEFMRNGG